jgi:opacity protein-like surface antigen
MLKLSVFGICLIGAILLSLSTASAKDISLYMWNQTISGDAYGRDSATSTRTKATLNEDTNNDKGFRLVAHFLGAPTEFGYTTISNDTSMNAEGTFSFNGTDFNFAQPLDYSQDIKMYEWFPRLPVFSTDKIGINLLLGVKCLDFKAAVSGTEDVSGTPITETMDEFIPVPQIGARFFIGSLTKGLRFEFMAKYLKLKISDYNVKALDAEAVAYVKGKAGFDFFIGWKLMNLNAITDEGSTTEAGIDLKNSGLMYGARLRF